MCGRFTLETPVAELAGMFGVDDAGEIELPARYNIAPTQPVAVVRSRGRGEGRELVLLRWGLLPGWVKDPGDWPTLVNARAETLGAKPAFEDAFRFRRCLVPADGFYEWRSERGGKQPYYVRAAADRPLAFAGLWERRVATDETIESCTIVTTDANRLLKPLHDRMPAILDAEARERWLDPDLRTPEVLTDLLRPFPSEKLVAYPVGRAVNRADVDGPGCIDPLEGGEVWRGEPPPSERAEGEAAGDRGPERAPGGEAGEVPGPAADEADGPLAPRQLDLF